MHDNDGEPMLRGFFFLKKKKKVKEAFVWVFAVLLRLKKIIEFFTAL